MLPNLSKVLVVTDFSDIGNRAIPYAYALADQGGEVHLLHLIEHQNTPSPLIAHYETDELGTPDKRKEVAARMEQRLTGLIPAEAGGRGITTQVAAAFHPHIAEGIAAEAKARGVDAIAMGSHGWSGIKHMLLGSVAEHVLRACSMPVIIVPNYK